jgi:hypothetical protein
MMEFRDVMNDINKDADSLTPFFECSECHLLYKDEEWAKQCEAWCKVHHSCNLAITAHAEKSSKNKIANSINESSD